MLPIDSVGLPLKCIQAQLQASMQRVQNLLTRDARGTLTQQDREKLAAQINEERRQREGLYESLAKIFDVVERFQPEQNTSVLSVSGNTPLHYDPTVTDIQQSEEVNALLRDVCVAEYAARNTADESLIARVKQETGLDYSACYRPMHAAIHELMENGVSGPMAFWARQAFGESGEKMGRFNTLLEEAGDTPEKRRALADYFKQEFVARYSATPGFPEHLLAKGFQVFCSCFCDSSKESKVVKFDTFSCTCPCCAHPQEYIPQQSSQMKSVLHCVYPGCAQVIDYENAKLFFAPGRGFMCETHGHAVKGAKRVILSW